MKKISFVVVVTSVLMVACNDERTAPETTGSGRDSVSTTAASEKKAWVPVDSATEMKAWMETATPTEAHRLLAKSDGKWKGESTMWSYAGAEPMKSTVEMNNRMIMGGRYQETKFKGEMMGMPIEGLATVGYDNYLKKYISTWIDNLGTGMMKLEGTYDPASKTYTYTGKMMNPANGVECDLKQVYRIIDDNTEVMEMYGPDSKTGKQFKNSEMTLTRVK